MGYISIRPVTATRPTAVQRLATGAAIGVFTDRLVKATRSTNGVSVVGPSFILAADLTGGGTAWGQIAASVSSEMTADECERLNRLTRGTKFPKFETNWRTGTVCMNIPGKRIPMPVTVSADLDTSGIVVESSLRWTPEAVPSLTTMVAPPSVEVAEPVAPPPTVASIVHGVTPPPVAAPTVATVGVAMARAALSPKPTPPVSGEAGTARAALTGTVSATPSLYAGKRTVSPIKPAYEPVPLKAVRVEPTGDPTGVFTYPTKGSGIVIPKGTEDDLDRVWKMHVAGDRQVVGLIGPAGTGKTSLAYDLAARHSVPVAKIDAAGAVTFADWVGFQSATERNGATVTEWQPSGFIQACRADGPMAGVPRMILIDEVNRAESSGSLNALLPVLDHTGSLYVADAGRAIPLDPAVMYLLTANMGGAYTGTVSLDQALSDRVTHWVEMLYPAPAVEVGIVVDRTGIDRAMADRLVNAAGQIRAIALRGEIVEGIGPRRVLMAARKIVAGFQPRSACYSTWSLAYSNEGGATSERNTVRSAIDAAFKS